MCNYGSGESEENCPQIAQRILRFFPQFFGLVSLGFGVVSLGFQLPPKNSPKRFTPQIVGIPPTPDFKKKQIQTDSLPRGRPTYLKS